MYIVQCTRFALIQCSGTHISNIWVHIDATHAQGVASSMYLQCTCNRSCNTWNTCNTHVYECMHFAAMRWKRGSMYKSGLLTNDRFLLALPYATMACTMPNCSALHYGHMPHCITTLYYATLHYATLHTPHCTMAICHTVVPTGPLVSLSYGGIEDSSAMNIQWWGDMAWPTKGQRQIQIQIKIQKQVQIQRLYYWPHWAMGHLTLEKLKKKKLHAHERMCEHICTNNEQMSDYIRIKILIVIIIYIMNFIVLPDVNQTKVI